MLEGKTIISTRPISSDDQIGIALEALGVHVIHCPVIEIQPVQVPLEILYKVLNAANHNWLVFTSSNGVDHFFNQIEKSGIKIQSFKIAVFGNRTAEALASRGHEANLINAENSSADLLKDLLAVLGPADRVLLILGRQASDLIMQGLKNKVQVDRIDVYETLSLAIKNKEIVDLLENGRYDLILFTSPTGYRSFKQQAGPLLDLDKLKIACLGPTTQKELLLDGLRPNVMAKPSGKNGLIKELEEYFERIHN
jgi:uroporphyrinogen-III synthase